MPDRGKINEIAFVACPKCDKPIAVWHGRNADGTFTAGFTHAVDPRVVVPR